MSPLQVAVALPQLDQLDAMNRKRSNCVNFITEQVAPQTKRWRWMPFLEKENKSCRPAYYKLAALAPDSAHRTRVIDAAQEAGLPIGEGFRGMHGSSERRCRRPFDLSNSKRLSERLMVLDHRALLIDQEAYPRLAKAIVQVHDDTTAM